MMDCKRAKQLMHEALDGGAENEPALAEHLAACAACRNEHAALRAVQNLVAAEVSCEPPEESLERVSAVVLSRLACEKQVHGGAAWRTLAVAASVMLVFGLGLLAGRELWPREIVRVERVPQVVERIVEREVPVIEERVVVERVPVVRTRIVYRDRPAESVTADLPPAPTEPVALEEHEIRITATPLPFIVTRTVETAPVTTVEDERAPETGRAPNHEEGSTAVRLALAPTMD